MTPEELNAIEVCARRRRIDVPMPVCTHDEERGHAPWCHDCDRERQERIGPTFETRGRADVLALVAEVRRLTTERDAAFTRGVEVMREAAAKVCETRAENHKVDARRSPNGQRAEWQLLAGDQIMAASEIRALKVEVPR